MPTNRSFDLRLLIKVYSIYLRNIVKAKQRYYLLFCRTTRFISIRTSLIVIGINDIRIVIYCIQYIAIKG